MNRGSRPGDGPKVFAAILTGSVIVGVVALILRVVAPLAPDEAFDTAADTGAEGHR